MQCAWAMLSSVACLALQYFTALCYKGQDFIKKNYWKNICAAILSTNISETFLILRKIERYLIKNTYWFSRQVAVIRAHFNGTRIISTYFLKILKCQISRKFIHHSFHADGQTDVTKPIVAFRNFAKVLKADSHVLCESDVFFFTF